MKITLIIHAYHFDGALGEGHENGNNKTLSFDVGLKRVAEQQPS
jgi:hypothetical protein